MLDGVGKAKDYAERCAELGMKACAITDHGNMFGVPEFVSEAKNNEIKPIIGCEFYLANGSHRERSNRIHADKHFLIIF